MTERLMKPWPIVGSRLVGHFRIFDLVEEEYEMPCGRGRHSFYVLLSRDWVNIVPITKEGRVVLIRQFRPGTQEVTIEVPGGMVDGGEDPAQAARRELEEETGYIAEQIMITGKVRPNPAFLRNTCHMFLAIGASPLGHTRMDESEDVQTFEAPWSEVEKMVEDGSIDHSLVLNTLYAARRHIARDPHLSKLVLSG